VRSGTESVPGVPGVPEQFMTSGNRFVWRGHRPGTGVPGVPALSNSLSPCPVAKSGCNTSGCVHAPSVLQPLFASGDVPLACH
jgi:hypothetical protein